VIKHMMLPDRAETEEIAEHRACDITVSCQLREKTDEIVERRACEETDCPASTS